MELYELDAPSGGFLAVTISKIKKSLGRQLRRMQYARMVNVMSQLSDEQLQSIDLTRADIPRHARECIFDDQA